MDGNVIHCRVYDRNTQILSDFTFLIQELKNNYVKGHILNFVSFKNCESILLLLYSSSLETESQW